MDDFNKDLDFPEGLQPDEGQPVQEDLLVQEEPQLQLGQQFEYSEFADPYAIQDNTSNENNPYIMAKSNTSDQNSSIENGFYQKFYYDNEPPQKKPGKSYGKFIALAITLTLILSAGVLAFAFRKPLLNTLAMATKSPAQYYSSVEKKAINNVIGYMQEAQEDVKPPSAVQMSSELTYDRNTLSSMLAPFGINIADYEQMLGISLDSVGYDIQFAHNNELYEMLFNLNLNRINIIGMELFLDSLKNELIFKVPDINDSYLKMPLDFDTDELFDFNASFEGLQAIDADSLYEVLLRYSDILIDHVDDVEMIKSHQLTVGNITEKCTKLTISINAATLYDIMIAILEEAKKDTTLPKLFQMSDYEYQQSIEELLKDLIDNREENFEDVNPTDVVIRMNLFIDSSGEIIGREITLLDEGDAVGTIGYVALENGKDLELELYIRDADGNDFITVTGKQKQNKDTYSGTISITIKNDNPFMPMNYIFNIDYEDVKTETIKGIPYYSGTYTLSSLSFMGTRFIVDFKVADNEQQVTFKVQLGSSSLITLDSKIKYLDDYTIKLPTDVEDFDENTFENFDVMELISIIAERLGISLDSLLYNFLF